MAKAASFGQSLATCNRLLVASRCRPSWGGRGCGEHLLHDGHILIQPASAPALAMEIGSCQLGSLEYIAKPRRLTALAGPYQANGTTRGHACHRHTSARYCMSRHTPSATQSTALALTKHAVPLCEKTWLLVYCRSAPASAVPPNALRSALPCEQCRTLYLLLLCSPYRLNQPRPARWQMLLRTNTLC